MTVTIIIVTLNRPDCVRRCLQRLENELREGDQVVVVDASMDDATARVVSAWPAVLYLRNENGLAVYRVAEHRAQAPTGRVIAFIDDDAFVRPGWLKALLTPYGDPAVGAVGGRA